MQNTANTSRKPCKIRKDGDEDDEDKDYGRLLYLIAGGLGAFVGIILGITVKIPGIDQAVTLFAFTIGLGVGFPVIVYLIARRSSD